jgi:hypothetical protein
MSFQSYLDNIKAKTGRTPEDFREATVAADVLKPGVTATQIVEWLAKDFDLGRGHAMCIFAVFKDNGWVEPKPKMPPKSK